ncbi:MAG: DUF6090 family protein [Maribacter sp.]|nr:DUF6090 family protein [Maribacter sp.]
MIKFFRKIRQNLLTENKFSKYLLYAIGEIVLVFIGILIALQVNNSNNDKKERKIEQEYLLSLQSEFNINLKKINDCIFNSERRENFINELLPLFDQNVIDTISNKELSKRVFNVLGSSVSYKPSTGVLTDIISSGNLNIILNKKLRNQLASFNSSLESVKTHENDVKSMLYSLHEIFYKNGSMRNLMIANDFNFEHHSISETVDNKQIFNSIEFENTLLSNHMLNRSANQLFYTVLKNEIEEILLEIDDNLIK